MCQSLSAREKKTHTHTHTHTHKTHTHTHTPPTPTHTQNTLQTGKTGREAVAYERSRKIKRLKTITFLIIHNRKFHIIDLSVTDLHLNDDLRPSNYFS